ncbi:MAG: MBL fold metallo-hydrolase [Candidatus Obscuribacter sp.]|jgi:metallo-beta-lactamase family protein|nr:MBL fold metallo-hydrolase [Candidatus Obscuribacter sp.]
MNKRQLKELDRTGRSALKLHILGAAKSVTGSLFLYEYFEKEKVTRFLVDAGLTVESPQADYKKRLPTGLNPKEIDFVILSHAHVDHCGYLPKLVKDGFRGKVYVTPATYDLMTVILPDSGYLQEEQAKSRLNRFNRQKRDANEALRTGETAATGDSKKGFKGKVGRGEKANDRSGRGKRAGDARKAVAQSTANAPSAADLARFAPLYTQEDAQESLKYCKTVKYHERFAVTDSIAFTFTDAGHILGAAVVNMEIGTGNQKRTFCFTGNVGRRQMPLLRDLEAVQQADYLMLEATYGDRLHQKRDRLESLATMIGNAYARAKPRHPRSGCGVIVIPAFAVGRAQTILNDLRILMETKRIPVIPVYVDGRMTNKATEVYRKHVDILNPETRKVFEAGHDPYSTPRQTSVTEYPDSAGLRRIHEEPCIIVGSSGMAAGGRIVDHLAYWLPHKQNTVMFVGFQGTGTLGQTIVKTGGERPDTLEQCTDCAKSVRIKGKDVRVHATVEFLPDYSAHADYEDQLAWLKKFTRRPKMTFIVHGDVGALDGLKGHIEETLGWKDVVIPEARQTFDL